MITKNEIVSRNKWFTVYNIKVITCQFEQACCRSVKICARIRISVIDFFITADKR